MKKSEELLDLRTKMGMNRKEFCDYFQVPYRTMVDWETGKNGIPEYMLRLMAYKAYAEKMCDEGRMLNLKLTRLEMANKKDHKVLITDEAIKKVPYIEYPEISGVHYELLQMMARKVLEVSKEKNNSGEVAITYSLESDGANEDDAAGIAIGGEHEVDPLSDTTSYHIIMNGKLCTVVTIHNHPSLTDFSMSDISFFLRYPNVKMMIVVTNLGKISYMVKREDYKKDDAITLFNEAVEINKKARNLKGLTRATDLFLHNCNKMGITYSDR